MKQLSKERARGLRVMQRLDSLHAEEREKVKAGKKPFFLKQSVKNTINLEERYVYKRNSVFCFLCFVFFVLFALLLCANVMLCFRGLQFCSVGASKTKTKCANVKCLIVFCDTNFIADTRSCAKTANCTNLWRNGARKTATRTTAGCPPDATAKKLNNNKWTCDVYFCGGFYSFVEVCLFACVISVSKECVPCILKNK